MPRAWRGNSFGVFAAVGRRVKHRKHVTCIALEFRGLVLESKGQGPRPCTAFSLQGRAERVFWVATNRLYVEDLQQSAHSSCRPVDLYFEYEVCNLDLGLCCPFASWDFDLDIGAFCWSEL